MILIFGIVFSGFFWFFHFSFVGVFSLPPYAKSLYSGSCTALQNIFTFGKFEDKKNYMNLVILFYNFCFAVVLLLLLHFVSAEYTWRVKLYTFCHLVAPLKRTGMDVVSIADAREIQRERKICIACTCAVAVDCGMCKDKSGLVPQ